MLTVENLRIEIEELAKLKGSALLQRLLEVRLPVKLSPSVICSDQNDECSFENCVFTLVAVPKMVDEKMESNEGNVADSNAISKNTVESQYDFLLSVGNGKFYKMVTKAYFGKFGIDAGSSEFTCQRCWFRKDDKVPSRFAEKVKRTPVDDKENPESGFLFTFMPVDNEETNTFIIQSKMNGKYLGPGGENSRVLCANYDTIEEATKFKLEVQLDDI